MFRFSMCHGLYSSRFPAAPPQLVHNAVTLVVVTSVISLLLVTSVIGGALLVYRYICKGTYTETHVLHVIFRY